MEVQQKVHNQIAAVVGKCLTTVFADTAYDFVIEFSKKRGKTEAALLFYRDGYAVDPLDAAGGGVVDIASFALRLASILCSRPKLRKLLVLDEPFKHINPDLVPMIDKMLLELAKETGTQIILITHLPGLNCGKVIRV
jgi:DNA repair exonuclease SbcCD ATPase subunit